VSHMRGCLQAGMTSAWIGSLAMTGRKPTAPLRSCRPCIPANPSQGLELYYN
jgi:hypothetical protein